MNLLPEQLKKAHAAKSAAELLSLAKAEGVPLTEAEAHVQFAKLNPPPGELSDSELDAVSGGGCGNSTTTPYPVGTIVGILDTNSDIRGELIQCGGCQSTRFVVTRVVDYDTVWVECEKHCQKAFSSRYGSGVMFNKYAQASILSLKRLEG